MSHNKYQKHKCIRCGKIYPHDVFRTVCGTANSEYPDCPRCGGSIHAWNPAQQTENAERKWLASFGRDGKPR